MQSPYRAMCMSLEVMACQRTSMAAEVDRAIIDRFSEQVFPYFYAITVRRFAQLSFSSMSLSVHLASKQAGQMSSLFVSRCLLGLALPAMRVLMGICLV